MRPILREPEEGADTVVWLVASPEPVGLSGRFFLDRHPRAEHVFPWTHETPEEAREVWDLCARLSGVQGDDRERGPILRGKNRVGALLDQGLAASTARAAFLRVQRGPALVASVAERRREDADERVVEIRPDLGEHLPALADPDAPATCAVSGLTAC